MKNTESTSFVTDRLIFSIHSTIKHLVRKGSSVALFDFPNYPNVGDSAIWLGQELYFNKFINAEIVAVDGCDLIGRSLPVLPPSTIVLIQGGGNFGDLYLHHQALREKLVSHYVDHRIIQLPQSIHFQDNNKKTQCRTILNKHKDFHLLVRDHDSLAQARELHDGLSYLCPDMALCLGARQRPVPPTYDIVCLLRTDKEKVPGELKDLQKKGSVLIADWLEEPDSFMKKTVSCVEKLLALYPRRMIMLYKYKRHFYHLLAKERFVRGERLLSSGKVVITDRLHGHIMSTLLNIPHVVLDNNYGKIRNFRDAWGTGGSKCLAAECLDDAFEKAKGLLNI